MTTAPDLSTLPVNMTRKTAADLVTRHFFPVSPRTLERWPLTGKNVGGRMVFPTKDLLAIAQRKMDEAPAVRSGPNRRAA